MVKTVPLKEIKIRNVRQERYGYVHGLSFRYRNMAVYKGLFVMNIILYVNFSSKLEPF